MKIGFTFRARAEQTDSQYPSRANCPRHRAERTNRLRIPLPHHIVTRSQLCGYHFLPPIGIPIAIPRPPDANPPESVMLYIALLLLGLALIGLMFAFVIGCDKV